LLRSDARLAVFRRAGEAAGFLPFHDTASGLVRPIGGALSDYHALVSTDPLGGDGPALLAEAGMTGFRFSGLIDPHGLFAASGLRDAHRIVLAGAPEAYLEQVRAVSPKKFKNYRRLDHKLDREIGALRLVADDASPEAFERLLQWKRDQLHRTGSFDFLAPDWTTGLLRSLFERREGDFRGLMVSLYAGERLVAGHFGVRLGATYHPWIASTDPDLAACSPGQIFLLRAIEAMPQLGLTTYDLGPGHDHYKRPYAFTQVQIGEGAALSSSAGWLPGAIEGAWSLAGAGKGGMVGRVRRRLDAIAAAETTVGARLRGVISAAASAGRAREAHAGGD
jgi:CelD/BcsL family acetyltransferase involved in cellulose biosynthesis